MQKPQESMAHKEEKKKQVTEAIFSEAQTLDLQDKDFKSGILNVFK